MTKRIVAVFLLALLTSAAFSGCSSKSSDGTIDNSVLMRKVRRKKTSNESENASAENKNQQGNNSNGGEGNMSNSNNSQSASKNTSKAGTNPSASQIPGESVNVPKNDKYPNNYYTPDTKVHYTDSELSAKNKIHVYFTEKTGDVPYLKKIAQFTPTWGWQQGGGLRQGALDLIPSIASLQPESMRVDFFMGHGGIGSRITDGSTDLQFSMIDMLSQQLIKNKITPYYAYFAATPFTENDGDWKKMPKNLNNWQTLCRNIAAFFKRKGIRLAGHEIWNEPDYDGHFFSGTFDDYTKLYVYGAKGIKSADPDAVVGGASVAWVGKTISSGGLGRFVNEAVSNNVTPDFISWHYYGNSGNISNLDPEYLLPIRNFLKNDSRLSKVQSHLNEFNIFQPSQDPNYKTYDYVPELMSTIERLNKATDITRIHWAASLEERSEAAMTGPGYGLIGFDTNQRYPLFRALWCYARLPVEAVKTEGSIGNIKTMAACDGRRAGIILYNTGSSPQSAKVLLDRIPFKKADVKIYSLDSSSTVAGNSDSPKVIASSEGVSTVGLKCDVTVAPNGLAYVEVSDGTGKSMIEENVSVGKIARKEYWYPQRGDNFPYSDFHDNSAVGYAGMASEANGQTACAVTLDSVSDKIKVDFEACGTPKKQSGSSMLGVRVDYQTASGYTKSVFYSVGGVDGNTAIPFGTQKAADKVISVNSNKGAFTMDIKGEAPSGFSKRVIISFVAKDSGKGSGARFKLTSA